MNKKPIIYMAGNMTPSPTNYYSWVLDMQILLEPKFRISESVFKEGSKFIVRQDLGRLTNAHMVVANLGVSDEAHHLTGLIVECYEAFKQNKPVYAFVSKDLKRSQQASSPWLREFITKEFETDEDLVKYLLEQENLMI